MLLSLFVLHQKLFKGGLKFLSGCGEGDQAFVERVLEGTPPLNHTHPFPEVCDLGSA